MYKVSDNYRKTIYSGEADYIPLLTINGVGIPYENISKIVIESPIVDTTSSIFYIGTFISQKLTITFRNTDGIDLNGEVYLQIGTKVNEEYEYVPIGYFIIDTSTEDFYTKSELVCMDRAILFKPNVNYEQAMVDGKVTAEDLLKWLCQYFRVELGTYPTTNADKIISSYDSAISGKRYISWIAELMGGNAKIGRDGKLYIIPLKSDPVLEIDALEGKSWEITEKYEITKVRFDNSTLAKEFGTDEGNTLNLRSENLFLQDADFTERIENVYNAVNGFEVWSLKCENVGDPSLDCWDIVSYNVDGKIYNTFYNSIITYEMTIMVKVEVAIPTKQAEKTTNIIEQDIASQVRKVTTIVNQLDATVKTTTTDMKTLKDDVDSMGDNYDAIKETVDTVQTSSSRAIAIAEELQKNGVPQVRTETGYVFDKEGLHIDKTGAPTGSQLDEAGLEIVDKTGAQEATQFYSGYVDETVANKTDELKNYQGQTVTYSKNIIFNNYLETQNGRIENVYDDTHGAGIGFFIGGN